MIFRIILLALLSAPVSAYAVEYADREDVQDFVRELAARESFNERELLTVFRHANTSRALSMR